MERIPISSGRSMTKHQGRWAGTSGTSSGGCWNESRKTTRSTSAGGTRTGATARTKRHPTALWQQPNHLMACGLINGMEMMHWLNAHPEWITIGEWSEERCAFPVYITDRGLNALANREQYDMEPVEGGLVEPGWKRPRDNSVGTIKGEARAPADGGRPIRTGI